MYQGAPAITTLHLLYQDSMIRVRGSCLHIVYPGAGAWVHILAPFAPSVTRLYFNIGLYIITKYSQTPDSLSSVRVATGQVSAVRFF